MFKRYLFSLVVLCFLGVNGFSQSQSLGQNDPDAAALEKKISDQFKAYKTVQINFTLKTENASGKVLHSNSGEIKMKGKKYKVEFGGREIYSDGSTVWTYDKGDKETQITKVDGSGNFLSPEKIFSDFYSKDYLYKMNDESKSGNKTIQQIELTPIDKSNAFFKILINVNKVSNRIVSAKVFEKNGNRYNYVVTGFKTNSPMADATFIYDKSKHPGVEIVDLR